MVIGWVTYNYILNVPTPPLLGKSNWLAVCRDADPFLSIFHYFKAIFRWDQAAAENDLHIFVYSDTKNLCTNAKLEIILLKKIEKNAKGVDIRNLCSTVCWYL